MLALENKHDFSPLWRAGWLVFALGYAEPVFAQEPWPDLYRRTCSSCHDGGGGGAPRLSQASEWAPRLNQGRSALLASALRGVPNSAMLPKGGYALSDAQVEGVLDWMLGQVRAAGSQTPSSQAAKSALNGTRTDLGVTGRVLTIEDLALGLREHLGRPDQTIERVDEQTRLIRGLGVRVQFSSGQVTLSGTVEETQTVHKAESWVRQQTGVTGVINRLVAAGVFEWD
jgi:cytochrome c5